MATCNCSRTDRNCEKCRGGQVWVDLSKSELKTQVVVPFVQDEPTL